MVVTDRWPHCTLHNVLPGRYIGSYGLVVVLERDHFTPVVSEACFTV